MMKEITVKIFVYSSFQWYKYYNWNKVRETQ